MANQRGLGASKLIEPQFQVLVEINDSLIVAGTLTLQEDSGSFLASFNYDSEYLTLARQGKAFALDPINLPLRPEPFETSSRYFRLGALFDAAPDAWGRTVMAKDEGMSPTSLTESTVLLKGRGSGVGAILFAPLGAPVVQPDDTDLPSMHRIDQLYETVSAVERGASIDEYLQAMLMSSWDMGGARPKVVVRDEDGAHWIVKFPRAIDTYSRQRNEWANLQMGRDIGMRVPETQLRHLADGDCALLIKRFDRSVVGRMRRQHYLSAVSLISPPAGFNKRQIDTPFGASIFSYARIADVIRTVSTNVTHDLQELFARMVFNVLIHNTDDHLKNTGFLMDADSTDFRYRLSPLFDVVTQEGTTKHMLHVGPGINNRLPAEHGRIGSLENARAGATFWGLKPAAVDSIIAKVLSVVARRHDYYHAAGMSSEEIMQVDRWVKSAD